MSLSMEFSRQEYCSGLPFPSPGALADPGIEPWSPTLQADSLLSEHYKTGLHLCVKYLAHPEIPAFPGEEYKVPDTRLGEVSSALQ